MIDKLLVFIIDSNLETLLNHQPETITAYKAYLVYVNLNGQARQQCQALHNFLMKGNHVSLA